MKEGRKFQSLQRKSVPLTTSPQSRLDLQKSRTQSQNHQLNTMRGGRGRDRRTMSQAFPQAQYGGWLPWNAPLCAVLTQAETVIELKYGSVFDTGNNATKRVQILQRAELLPSEPWQSSPFPSCTQVLTRQFLLAPTSSGFLACKNMAVNAAVPGKCAPWRGAAPVTSSSPRICARHFGKIGKEWD